MECNSTSTAVGSGLTPERSESSLPVWPFLTIDVFLLGTAVLVVSRAHRPLQWWEVVALLACVGGGAWSFLFPFLRRNECEHAMAQARLAACAVSQIQQLDQVAGQITAATAQWQSVQEQATQTAQLASNVTQKMALEAKTFAEFLQKSNDTEKNHLRLEVEKLRRAEAEWLQLAIRLLDHVFALFQAATHSGRPDLAEQVGRFQAACRDTARRMGLAPMVAKAGEAFDARQHQLLDGELANGDAVVAGTLATGYTYQGQLVRRALVKLARPEDRASGGS